MSAICYKNVEYSQSKSNQNTSVWQYTQWKLWNHEKLGVIVYIITKG